ncbi:MAG: hypothetical protein M3O22_03420 [Pseudomonadota bacterium]|nr:hypothetical protein [Pseudomonadota bacterium]
MEHNQKEHNIAVRTFRKMSPEQQELLKPVFMCALVAGYVVRGVITAIGIVPYIILGTLALGTGLTKSLFEAENQNNSNNKKEEKSYKKPSFTRHPFTAMRDAFGETFWGAAFEIFEAFRHFTRGPHLKRSFYVGLAACLAMFKFCSSPSAEASESGTAAKPVAIRSCADSMGSFDLPQKPVHRENVALPASRVRTVAQSPDAGMTSAPRLG